MRRCHRQEFDLGNYYQSVLSILRHPLFAKGCKTATAGIIGTGIWGVVTGLAMVKAGLSTWQAIGMTIFVFSGTAQLAALPLMVIGTPIAIVLTTALLANLRFVLYSAIIAKYFGQYSLLKRTSIGYLTIDSGLAAYTANYDPTWTQKEQIAYWAGCVMPIWAIWQVCSLLGIAMAGFLPDSKGYAFVGLLAIFAIIVPLIKNKATVACALCAAAVAIIGASLGQSLPPGIATLAAVFAGIAGAVVFAK